ncbi:MAG: hypothetical protein H7254_06130 [Ferruginibacter sp.]|nr:hypothetical protein [Ferruginibacter sp.]
MNKQIKTQKMKKVLFVFAIAASFTACNNATQTPATNSIDSAKTADSIKAATPAMDTAAKKMDSAAAKMDTAAKKMNK